MSSKGHEPVPPELSHAPAATDSRARHMTIRWVEVGTQRLRVAIWPGEPMGRPPLLLFNGIGSALEFLAPLAEAQPGVETIAFDIPGAGRSPSPRHPYRLWMMVRLVSRMLDQLGYAQVDVLGVSWGGTLAQQFALQHPRRCRRLILVATTHGIPMVPPSLSVLLKFATPRRFNDAKYLARIAGDLYGGALRAQPGLIRSLAPVSAGADRRGYLFQQLALLGWSSLPWLPLLPQRTLVLAGRDDPIVPLANARLMARLLRCGRLHVVDDGHLFLVSNPVAAGRIVSRFLAAP
jgi:poly(3-hydroxyalkanoate) depolymerase